MATVLIIDDIEENRLLLQYCLEDDGHVVWTEPGGIPALERLQKERPDIIFLDISMPEMDGIEVLKALKSDQKLKDIPVIMVTALDMEERIIEALDLGAQDYVSKPFSFPVLAARMRTSIRLKRMQDNLRRTNQRLEVMSTTDLLTGLYNRRHFFDLANKEITKAQKFDRSLFVAVIGVDHLKDINDGSGTSAGDRVLIEISKKLKQSFNDAEIIGRVSGGEFALCMPDATLEQVMEAMEDLRVTVETQPINLGAGATTDATISIGLSQLTADDVDIAKVLRRSDSALHKAKRGGRNTIVKHEVS